MNTTKANEKLARQLAWQYLERLEHGQKLALRADTPKFVALHLRAERAVADAADMAEMVERLTRLTFDSKPAGYDYAESLFKVFYRVLAELRQQSTAHASATSPVVDDGSGMF